MAVREVTRRDNRGTRKNVTSEKTPAVVDRAPK